MNKLELPILEADGARETSRAARPTFGDLLESTKLSRLPSLPKRQPFNLPDFSNTPSSKTTVTSCCAGCGGKLDCDDTFQQSVRVCRKCLAHYAKIETAIDEASKRKRRELLEKYAGGVS